MRRYHKVDTVDKALFKLLYELKLHKGLDNSERRWLHAWKANVEGLLRQKEKETGK